MKEEETIIVGELITCAQLAGIIKAYQENHSPSSFEPVEMNDPSRWELE